MKLCDPFLFVSKDVIIIISKYYRSRYKYVITLWKIKTKHSNKVILPTQSKEGMSKENSRFRDVIMNFLHSGKLSYLDGPDALYHLSLQKK